MIVSWNSVGAYPVLNKLCGCADGMGNTANEEQFHHLWRHLGVGKLQSPMSGMTPRRSGSDPIVTGNYPTVLPTEHLGSWVCSSRNFFLGSAGEGSACWGARFGLLLLVFHKQSILNKIILQFSVLWKIKCVISTSWFTMRKTPQQLKFFLVRNFCFKDVGYFWEIQKLNLLIFLFLFFFPSPTCFCSVIGVWIIQVKIFVFVKNILMQSKLEVFGHEIISDLTQGFLASLKSISVLYHSLSLVFDLPEKVRNTNLFTQANISFAEKGNSISVTFIANLDNYPAQSAVTTKVCSVL